MSRTTSIKIGDRVIGPGQPIFIVAEVGINHNGDMVLAREQIDAAAEAGADSVKFQSYDVNDFISDKGLTFTYKSQGKSVTESQYELFSRCQVNADDLMMLKEHCDKRGVVFHATPTSEQGIRDLLRAGAPVLKNGSDYLSHVDLVAAMGRTGLPTVLSTGMASEEDIEESVSYFRKAGNDDIIVLQCTSNYPTAAKDVHLARMLEISERYDCLGGLSDHTQGSLAGVGAAMLGGVWLEKHFTSDHNLPGPDHWFSCNPEEFAQLVRDVRAAEQGPQGIEAFAAISQEAKDMIGLAHLSANPKEEESRKNFRLSCVAAKDLAEGHVLGQDDIAYQRPGTGWRPSYAKNMIGKALTRPVRRSHVFNQNDIKQG
jgi:N,N'-diacetyllegionaminate synthase